MKRKQRRKLSSGVLAALALALWTTPATGQAWEAAKDSGHLTSLTRTFTATLRSPISRAPLSKLRPTTRQSVLTVELSGSFGLLPDGVVRVRSAEGELIAEGPSHQPIELTQRGPVVVTVEATSLADSPTITLEETSFSGEITAPVELETGLLRVEARRGGQRISGVVRLTRRDEATGRFEAEPCGTVAANGVSRELSAGTYRVSLIHQGETFSQVVTVGAGASRLVRLGS